MNLDHKCIVITGASSGIGRAILHMLSERPVHVVAVGRDQARLLDAVAFLGDSKATAMPFRCNLARQDEVDRLFAYALERMGAIDIFFANAGFGYWERNRKPHWGRIEAIFQTNVFSPIYVAQKMQALFPDVDYRVVITSSVLGRIGLENYALYAATKAALDRFSEVYRLESGRRRRLVLVYPLAVRTGFFQTAGGGPIPWPSQSPEAVARAMLRGIERDRETIYTSPLLRPMLLLNHLLPPARRLYQLLDGKFARRHWSARARMGEFDDER